VLIVTVVCITLMWSECIADAFSAVRVCAMRMSVHFNQHGFCILHNILNQYWFETPDVAIKLLSSLFRI
jgi:hypothetical protein